MKKFLVSTANVYGYDEKDNLLFVGKTLLDTSLETTLSNTDVRAGQGNQLQYVYYHTAEMNITISEAQFNLDYLALSTGSSKVTGAKVWTQESVDVVDGAGTVKLDPLKGSTDTIYGWVTKKDGTVERVTFTGKQFSIGGSYNGKVCVRYYSMNDAAKQVTIYADMVPSVIHLVMEAMLASSDASTNRIGTVEIDVPRASMTGAFSLSMTPDSVASTPLNVRALSAVPPSDGSCSGGRPIYATITEIIDNANWYDDVIALGVVDGDFELADGEKKMLEVRAIPSSGAAFKPNYNDLTFEATTVTVENSDGDKKGEVTGATGGGTVTVKITEKPEIEVTVKVTEGG